MRQPKRVLGALIVVWKQQIAWQQASRGVESVKWTEMNMETRTEEEEEHRQEDEDEDDEGEVGPPLRAAINNPCRLKSFFCAGGGGGGG